EHPDLRLSVAGEVGHGAAVRHVGDAADHRAVVERRDDLRVRGAAGDVAQDGPVGGGARAVELPVRGERRRDDRTDGVVLARAGGAWLDGHAAAVARASDSPARRGRPRPQGLWTESTVATTGAVSDTAGG